MLRAPLASFSLFRCFLVSPSLVRFSSYPLSRASRFFFSLGLLISPSPSYFSFPPLPWASHSPSPSGFLFPPLSDPCCFPLFLALCLFLLALGFLVYSSPSDCLFPSLPGSLLNARHAALPVKTGCQRKVCSRSWFLQ